MAEARGIDEVKEISDKMEELCLYARQRDHIDMEASAAEINARALRPVRGAVLSIWIRARAAVIHRLLFPRVGKP